MLDKKVRPILSQLTGEEIIGSSRRPLQIANLIQNKLQLKRSVNKIKTQNKLREQRNNSVQFNINSMFRPRYKFAQRPIGPTPFYKTSLYQLKSGKMFNNQMRKVEGLNLKGVTKQVFERDIGNDLFSTPSRPYTGFSNSRKQLSTSSIKVRLNKNLNKDLDVIEDL